MRIGGMLSNSISVWADPKKGLHKIETLLLNWYATKRPFGASEDEIASIICDPTAAVIVEKGMPDITTFGASKL